MWGLPYFHIGRRISVDTPKYYKVCEFDFNEPWGGFTFDLKLIDEEYVFDLIEIYFSGRTGSDMSFMTSSQYKFLYDSKCYPNRENDLLKLQDISIVSTKESNRLKNELYLKIGKSSFNSYLLGSFSLEVSINGTSYVREIKAIDNLPSGSNVTVIHPLIRKYT